MQTFGTNPEKYTMNVIGFGHKEIIRYLCQRNYSIKITKMKKIILTMAIAFAAVVNVCGQSELIGRVYDYELSQDGQTLTEISSSPQAILKRIK